MLRLLQRMSLRGCLREADIDWIKEILKRGITAYEIEVDMPESRPYLIEVLGEIATFGVK